MSKSPELYRNKLPKITMAAIALFSMGIKPDARPPAAASSHHEIDAHLDPSHLSYPSKPIAALINDHLIAKDKPMSKAAYHPSPARIAANEVTPLEREEWSKVNICEESGNWHPEGEEYTDAEYSTGIGIDRDNWIIYGGRQFAPSGAQATEDEQIVVGMRIEPDPPDQNGCNPKGW